MQMCPSCNADNSERAKFCVRCGAQLRRLLGFGAMLKGRYKVVRVLGCGGMGAVYLAFDTRVNDAPVAVKENLDQSPEAQQQFVSEARILMKLRHTNLPRVRDYFVEHNGRQYMVMDYIAGEDLDTLVQRQGPLPIQKALYIADRIAAAVQYLHEHDPPVIHRDIKPSNIKLTPTGEPVLVDFGIAKFYRPGQKTLAGARAVSPGFSPIEQYGHGTTDQRSDIYAFGATLYYILSGIVPPEAIERAAGATDKLIPVRSINPNVPPHVDRAIWVAMRVRPDERFKSMHEFRLALQGKLLVKISPPKAVAPQRTYEMAQSQKAQVGQHHAGMNRAQSGVQQQPQPHPTPSQDMQQDIFSLSVPQEVLSVGPPASPAIRIIASILDLAVLIPALYIVAIGTWGLGQIAMSMIYGPENWAVNEAGFKDFALIVVIGGFMLYRFLSHWWWGQTMGKSLFKLCVVTNKGTQPSLLRILFREIIFALTLLPCMLINIFVLTQTPTRQSLHDVIVDTFVVHCKGEGEGEADSCSQ
ncbi:MAG: protein kinase [Armatimonadota bacterium]|nr:protein kinase [Armatimonadota bacterium]MCX7777813.1 protein kinase [Armatimonadota bacterium]MDW8025927.1 protein kinase [Armatimonadota bacterium]